MRASSVPTVRSHGDPPQRDAASRQRPSDVSVQPFFVRIHPTIRAIPGLSAPAPPSGDLAEAGLEPIEPGRIWAGRRFRQQLRTAGLDRFEAVMDSTLGRCMRVLEDRENWRITLNSPGHLPRTVFLKKHHIRRWSSRLRRRLGYPPPDSAGRVEARNARRLAAAGIGVMELIAWGEHLHADGRLESFLITDELRGYQPLDRFLLDRFSQPDARNTGLHDRCLLRLIRRVASLARMFHRAGYNHRDLYCCHFFIKEPSPGRFDIRLIDLQRVQHRRWFRRRWLVKDLAQLAFSAPCSRINRSHRTAFMRYYLGVKKLPTGDKLLVLSVLLKQRLMEWKLGARR